MNMSPNPMRLIITLITILIAAKVAAQPEISQLHASATGDLRLTYSFKNKEYPIRIYVPSTYTSQKQYPAIVAIHGGGVDENSYFDLYDHGRIKKVAEQVGMIIICPPRLGTQLNDELQSILTAMQTVSSQYRLDPNRLYLFGHSAGGSLCLHIAQFTPHPFAAIASFAGVGFLKPVSSSPPRHVPIFLAAATGDRIVPIHLMRQTRETLQQAGFSVQHREIEGNDHNHFVASLYDELFAWCLSFH